MKKNETKAILGNPSNGLEYQYILWLCSMIERRGRRESQELASLLYSIPFEWSIPNDDNRAADGKELRKRFYEHMEQHGHISGPCTMLEMLVALACKIDEIMTDNPEQYRPERWFWEMVDNLGLRDYEDERNKRLVLTFMRRQYEPNGKGGLFPLRRPPNDQREVEIWYQLMAYVNEKYPDL